MRKVSLIATVLNESRSLQPWLKALKSQTRQPDEIVICDGGSKDGTLAILEAFAQERSVLPLECGRNARAPSECGRNARAPSAPLLRVISQPCKNIATGRNAAISAASGEIIAVTDAGSLPNPDWLNEILKPFDMNPDAQVVAGSYRFLEDTRFRKAASAYLGKPWTRAEFKPSSRSIAFTKQVWASVGGYPEWLTQAAEDTLFNHLLAEKGVVFHSASQALVVWNMRSNLVSLLRMIARNAHGDAEAQVARSMFWRALLKLIIEFFILIAIILTAVYFLGLSGGLLASAGAIIGATIARAIMRGAPPISWLEFSLLCVFGGPTYIWGYLRGKVFGRRKVSLINRT